MPDAEIRVGQRLLAADALRRIERQHLAQQVDRQRVRARIQSGERDPRLDGQRPDVVLRPGRPDAP